MVSRLSPGSPTETNGSKRQVQHLLGAERVLEHVIGVARRPPSTSPRRRWKSSATLVSLAALEVLEVGEGAGGLELVVHDRRRGHRLDLVEHGRQLLVLGVDELRRLARRRADRGQHHRDRLADVAHLVDRQDRLVVERRAVVRVRE